MLVKFFFDYLLIIWIIENNTNLYYHIIGIYLNEAKHCVAKEKIKACFKRSLKQLGMYKLFNHNVKGRSVCYSQTKWE